MARIDRDMSAWWSLLAAPAGAVATTLIGVFAGSAVSRRAQDRHWVREQVAATCARVLRESSGVLVSLSEAESGRPSSIPQGVVHGTGIDWRPWNEALSMVNLVADKAIAEAAHTLDEEIWRLHAKVRRGLTPEENWFVLRARVESAQNNFIVTARRRLSLAGDPLERFSGRPAPDDPIWTS
ncbi:hypothetical protein [Streptomyces olivochromogenes]|uniref:hypothetical protein n=1 Tax=Streptomyces olivochromogenes TaxID=1963 RepID=UPI001F30F6B0|nr:hypothetical protein [Streptomyces olivochromogenes]MCF3131091.1 hypothetical protein [Streptomyces olivochromogenes]